MRCCSFFLVCFRCTRRMCSILSKCVLAIHNTPETFGAAWCRFDVEVGHLKRLSTQIAGIGVSTVPAMMRSQSRRRSAANRQAIVGLQGHGLPQQTMPTSSTCKPDVLSTVFADTVLASQTSTQSSEHAPTVTRILQPCASNIGFFSPSISTSDASSGICPATVCTAYSSPSHTVTEGSSVTASTESQSDRLNITWTHPADLESTTGHADESTHLVMSADEDVSTASAVTLVTAVTSVGACQQACHSVAAEAEMSAHCCQLSSPRQHQTEGFCRLLFVLIVLLLLMMMIDGE